MGLTRDLETAQVLISRVLVDLKENPETDALTDLLDACESIDRYYKEHFCAGCDFDFDKKIGTTYEDGISLEFYIEADWWHDISKAIRILRPEKINKHGEEK